ncbi:MAG: hypothetical protein COB15_11420 [Flavobacteriales bacterium]|nr:MAG: hypothetical protein COB15_11420 [Flavobacteriales bacterium]
MKASVLILLLLFNFSGQEKNILQKYLHKAADYPAIEKYFQIIAKKKDLYKKVNNYIPTFSPLNPNKKKRYSSKFGRRFHPIDKRMKQHLGLDISAPTGTPIHTTASGIVKLVKTSNIGYGNQVEVLHGFGFQTKYAHMSKIIVKKGQKVKKGDIIGFVGTSGKSTAPHLHYEIKKNKKHIDPYPFCFID